MKKNGTIRIFIIVLLIIFLIILGFLSYTFFNNLQNTSEEDFVSQLTSMGETVYSDYYYKITAVDKTDEELASYLEQFKDIGLKFDLVQLEKYNDENKQVIDRFIRNNKDCKKEETMVIIYPKSPYSNTDFTSEIQMDCGYKK